MQSTHAVILVVDDDTAIRELMVAAFEDEGYHVLQAADGAQALHLVSQTRPSVVVLDIQMPESTGWRSPGGSSRPRDGRHPAGRRQRARPPSGGPWDRVLRVRGQALRPGSAALRRHLGGWVAVTLPSSSPRPTDLRDRRAVERDDEPVAPAVP
jgi:hypothetical protein